MSNVEITIASGIIATLFVLGLVILNHQSKAERAAELSCEPEFIQSICFKSTHYTNFESCVEGRVKGCAILKEAK